jgi:hypothetical protein
MEMFMQFSEKTTQSRASVAAYDIGLREYMQRVYSYMGGALAVTGLVSFLIGSNEALLKLIFGTPLGFVAIFAPIGLVFFMSFRMHKMSVKMAQGTFWAYAALMGVSLGSVFAIYTGASIARAFFITASVFGALSLYGYTTKRDLSKFGTFLFIGVVGIFIASIVNVFLKSSGLEFALSIATVLVFAGLTAYDTQNIKEEYFVHAGGDQASLTKVAIFGALRLYMDFINLMIVMLKFFGERR